MRRIFFLRFHQFGPSVIRRKHSRLILKFVRVASVRLVSHHFLPASRRAPASAAPAAKSAKSSSSSPASRSVPKPASVPPATPRSTAGGISHHPEQEPQQAAPAGSSSTQSASSRSAAQKRKQKKQSHEEPEEPASAALAAMPDPPHRRLAAQCDICIVGDVLCQLPCADFHRVAIIALPEIRHHGAPRVPGARIINDRLEAVANLDAILAVIGRQQQKYTAIVFFAADAKLLEEVDRVILDAFSFQRTYCHDSHLRAGLLFQFGAQCF